MLDKFKLTFLFCIKTIAISNIDKTIKLIVKIDSIFYFLLNNIEYNIFKKVKIATAIIKLIPQDISYFIHSISKTSLIILSNNHNNIIFIIKTTNE